MNSLSLQLQLLATADFSLCISLFCSPSPSHHVPCFFHLMRVAGQRKCPTVCVCVCVWVCAFHCLWGHEIAPKPQGTLGTVLPRHRAFLSVLTLSLSPSALPSSSPCIAFRRLYGRMHLWFLSTCRSSLCSHGDLHPKPACHLPINHRVPWCCWGE